MLLHVKMSGETTNLSASPGTGPRNPWYARLNVKAWNKMQLSA